MSVLITGAAVGAGAAAGVMARGCFWPRSGIFAPVTWRGERGGKPRVAITFDDGPDEAGTVAVLEVLRRERAAACFFVIGANAARWPGLVRRMHEEDHLIANHTQDHHYWGMFRGTRYWREQAERADEVVEKLIGRRPALFRPPMGFKHPLTWRGVRDASGGGRRMVTWTRRGFDGVGASAERIERRLLRGAGPGDVLLMHDGAVPGVRRDAGATAAALPRVIAGLRERGLEIVRLDELLGVEGYR